MRKKITPSPSLMASSLVQNLSPEHLFRFKVFTPRLALLSLSCIWLLLILAVNPNGNFPLNDDWSYGLIVKSLISNGNMHIIEWIATTSVAQILWGTLFCLPFGFSFTALRVSTLVLGLIGILATYQLLKETTFQHEIPFLGALIVATNPLYFALSNTFMTDVPFYTVAVLTFFFLIRSLHRENKALLVIGSIFACLAILIRQVGIVIPLSFSMAYILRRRIRKEDLWIALFPTALGVLTLSIYWITLGGPVNYGHFNLKDALTTQMGVLLISILKNEFGAFAYLGLFLFPFLLILLPRLWSSLTSQDRIWITFTSTAIWIGILGLMIMTDRSMPFLKEPGNILIDTGLGPATLRDVSILNLPHFPRLPKTLWLIISAISAFSAILLFQIFLLTARRLARGGIRTMLSSDRWAQPYSSTEDRFLIFAMFICAFYLALIGITGFYDRYLLFLLPFFLCISLKAEASLSFKLSRWQRLCVFALIGIYASFSIGATHDYFSWNRARWAALQHLVEQLHISPSNIDGGYEFNGWYGYDSQYQPSRAKSWWWVENDDYVIAFGSMANYEVLNRFSYKRWIPYGQGLIYVLHRKH